MMNINVTFPLNTTETPVVIVTILHIPHLCLPAAQQTRQYMKHSNVFLFLLHLYLINIWILARDIV